MASISVVLPTYNESKNKLFLKSLGVFSQSRAKEVIIVDRKSTDDTQDLVRNYGYRLIETTANSRAARLNEGIKAATSDIIVLHHPRSCLSISAFESLAKLAEEDLWGGFTHSFAPDKHWLLDFTSWYSNSVRADHRHIFYLDHCIFFRKDLLKDDPTPVPEVDIFEDTELSKKLRALAKPVRLPQASQTSSIRFRKNGLLKQSLMNQALKVGYSLNLPHKWMNRGYEKGLNLNSTYTKK